MCGLAGVAGTLEKNQPDDHNIFSGLLYVSAFRGLDSTGVASRSFAMDKGEIDVYKTTLASPEFLELPKARKVINNGDQLIMGHTRSRTVGEVNKKNAQPFEFDNVVGTHNGTLDWHTKAALEGQGKLCSVDSEALYYRLDKDGLDGVLKCFQKGDAAALVWYDRAKHRLNFYRNEHRPLFYCYSPDRKKVYWASEAGMLYLILNRAPGAKMEKVRMLPEHLHWSQPLPDKKGVPFPKPETRFCKPPVPKPVAQIVHKSAADSAQTFKVTDHRACADLYSDCGTHISNGTVRVNAGVGPDVKVFAKAGVEGTIIGDKIVDLSKFRLDRMIVRGKNQGGPHYKSPYSSQSYDQQRFEAKMNEGCCVCGSCPAWGEPVKFLRDDNIICASCMLEANKAAGASDFNNDVLLIVNQFA